MSQQPPLTVLQDWLDSYLNFEAAPKKNIFWLDTMNFLCGRFKNPHEFYKKIHVAGSKGKGSVSAMVASILESAGNKTGLYTSPHILDFSERIGTAHAPLEEAIYEKSVLELMHSIDPIIPEQLPGERTITWFELVTTFAFLCFKNANMDWAVFETGLGGRLDATNVITPNASVITPIELEHTEFLGNSLEEIAKEKAGIIKHGVPVFIAKQNETVANVFKQKAAECGSPVFFADDLLTSCKGTVHGDCTKIELDSPLFLRPIKTCLKLMGSFQAENAGLAAVTIKTLFPCMDESVVEEGLAKATLPGRFEMAGNKDCPIIMDGAHTPKSVSLSLETFNFFVHDIKSKPHLIFSCAADKKVEEIAKLFIGFDKITLTRPGEAKESDLNRMMKAFSAAGLEYKHNMDYVEAIQQAVWEAQKAKTPLLVIGSFYLVAEAKKIIAAQSL